ncbi:MAG: tyrosine-type recombinase/integrase [Acidobacteria bacterium]|nr:tyrosine-type recombinase/integrase [Acidobacteriota bacterium]
MTKAQAQEELAAILAPLNSRQEVPSDTCTFGEFLQQTYLPFYRRKWKCSTAMTNQDRIRYHLVSEFRERRLGSLTRDELQSFLDQRAEAGLSFSTVDHLRWDLKQVFNMAVAEGYLRKNPAALLFTPREAHRATKRQLGWDEVRLIFAVLDLRELLICTLAIVAGMRPGEILGLTWGHIKHDHIEIRQRVYRGKVDSPKTAHSVREVALSEGLRDMVDKWKSVSFRTDVDAWVFASETLKTPLARENCWRRHISPNLRSVGLGWVNFQVMRRTHSSLMRELNIDPKIVADQLGHTLDVNLNVYTQSALAVRKDAVNTLESALNGAKWSRPLPAVV